MDLTVISLGLNAITLHWSPHFVISNLAAVLWALQVRGHHVA